MLGSENGDVIETQTIKVCTPQKILATRSLVTIIQIRDVSERK